MGLENLSLGDVQLILMIKMCLVVFFIFGFLTIYYKWSPVIFLTLTGILVSTSYLLLVNNLGLTFWGLRGDEVTITAMYEMFAHGSFWSDFGFPDLPPFYPPLFFWIFAFFGRLFDWNGVMMVKASVASTFLIFPIFVYSIQSLYWKSLKNKSDIKLIPGKLAWALVPFIVFIFIDWDAFILKPYEVLVSAGTVMWVSFLLNDLHNKIWSKKRMLVYGITGGVLFMTYYLWLIFGAIAVALSGLFVERKNQWFFYKRIILVGLLTLFFASPFLLPLVIVYQKYGTENWQVAFMSMRGLALYVSMVQWFTWRGVFLLVAFISLLWYRKNIYIRSLLLLFISGFIWQVMGWTTILLFSAPLQEFKPFDFYHFVILAFALAFALEKVYFKLKEKYSDVDWRVILGTLGLVFVSVFMIFGSFIDDPVVQARRVENTSLRINVAELVDFLKLNQTSFPGPMTFGPGVGEIHAFVPINSYLYFNQHNNHPATRFSEKMVYLDLLKLEKDSESFHKAVKEIPFGPIDRWIMFRNEGADYYKIYLHIDVFPNGAKNHRIDLPKELFAEPYFAKVFENQEFTVFDIVD